MILPKIKIKKILFATDLSESARQSLAYAVSLSNLYGAGITIVHALEETQGMEAAIAYHVGAEAWARIKKKQEDSARSAIIGKQRAVDPGMKDALKQFYETVSENEENQSFVLDEVVVGRGNPVDVIIEAAEAKECDLIVMGSHGHGGLTGILMGSTAKKVVQQAKIPVLIVRLPE
ncbi:MAG: universal stress protein [Desulfobacula sp.]|nr:universal stress protein [Desulfobacula sp.]MDA8134867.1 universal stress protein [Desulfobacteraceae bacterium]